MVVGRPGRPAQQPVALRLNALARACRGPSLPSRARRYAAASEQDRAATDRRGYEARDHHDKAAAEEWVCRALQAADYADDQAAFAGRLKQLIAQEDYQVTGIYDDVRFERHVRGQLRKVAKMTTASKGFEKTLRFQ